MDYYWYCKFLLYLPLLFQNRRLISKYQAMAIVLSVEKLSSKLIDGAPSVLVLAIILSASFAKLLLIFLVFCVICSSLFFLLELHFFPLVSG